MQEVIAMLGAERITTVLLLTVRITAVLLLTPVLYGIAMPTSARLLAIIGLACMVSLPFGSAQAVSPQDFAGLVQAMMREVAVGATLGLGILMAFAGFSLAGSLIDVQVGFGMAQVIDPASRARLPILSAVFGLYAAVFFFLVDGHHALLRGVAYSVERFPVGQGWAVHGAADVIVKQAAALFSLGFALAAPVVLGLLLVEFALGVVSRNLPQMNMLVMGIPVKILAGLLALSVWASIFSAPAQRLYGSIYKTWTVWFAIKGGR